VSTAGGAWPLAYSLIEAFEPRPFSFSAPTLPNSPTDLTIDDSRPVGYVLEARKNVLAYDAPSPLAAQNDHRPQKKRSRGGDWVSWP
jgi:hypothetical protein